MSITKLKYKDWEFEVERELTIQTYEGVASGGSDTCICNDCKNYIATRDKVFPNDNLDLFEKLGKNYKKEVEISHWNKIENGLCHIGGWFHFKGKVLSGKNYKIQLPQGGFTFDLTKISENFSIGFSEGNDLTFFGDKTGLVQIEFDTFIPWIIEEKLEG